MKRLEERCRKFRDQVIRDTENQKNNNVTRFARPFSKIPPIAAHEQVDERPVTLFLAFNGDFSGFNCCERTARYFNDSLGMATRNWSELYKTHLLRSAEAAYEGTSLHRVRPGKDQLAVSSCGVTARGSSFETTRFAVVLILMSNLGELLDEAMIFSHDGYDFKFRDLVNESATRSRSYELDNQTG